MSNTSNFLNKLPRLAFDSLCLPLQDVSLDPLKHVCVPRLCQVPLLRISPLVMLFYKVVDLPCVLIARLEIVEELLERFPFLLVYRVLVSLRRGEEGE